MGLAFKILLLFVAVSLDRGDCGVFVKTIRQRRALLPNITSGRPTTVNHVYNIRLPDCKSWSANLSKPLARIFEAQDEARDDKRFEHTVDPTNQVVFTHRINIPPQVCGCDDIQALLSRLEVLEKQVATLRQQCSSNACCGAKRALDCGAHGTFSASTCGCVCEEGWSGPHCSEASCPANCQGDCVAGRCVCQAGFTGKDCSEEICPDNCNDQGRCINDKCVCFPGYTGHGCTEETCPDDCKGRGRCVDGSCVCKEGYSGPDCGIVACPGDCNGQGRCVEGRCICNAGFSGRDCGLRGCPANCHGRGRCVNGKCICGKGFTGSDCGVKACPQNCNDRGQCVNGKCVCRKGFTGSDCGVKACPQNCNDRGQCVNGKCVCRKGFTGSDCGVKACPQNCNDRGQCVNGKCVCRKGFTGSDCGVKACPQNCNDRGQCVNGKCVCRKGFTGSDCGVKTCPQNCNDRGQCVNGKCVCNSGFSGPACSVQTCPNNCSQQGQCINGKCVCNKGYSGPKCGVQDCLNNCNNRGRCVDRKCICKDGFTGNDCSIEIPAPIGLHVKKILETKVTVEWQLPRVPVDGWKITFQPLKEDNGKLTNRVAGSKTSFQQTGLASGQEYEVTLQAEKDKKQGPGVSRTLTTLIDGPRNLHVVSATNSTIKLGWNRPQASIDRYRLNYSSATGKHSQVVVPPGDSSAVLTGLEAGVEHTISLVGERGGHQSKAAATKGTTVIDSPRNLRIVTVTDSTIELEWEKSVARVGHYHIVYSSETGKRGELRVSGKGNTATLVGLQDGTEYTISLVGEEGKMKSKPVITVGTTESLTQREFAGTHSTQAVAANESQIIHDISRAISRKIAATELSADVGMTARSVIRRYPAFVKKPVGSPKVLLGTSPARVKTSSERGQKTKESKDRQSPVRKVQEPSSVGKGRLVGPGRKVTGSPGTISTVKLRNKGLVGSPSLNGMQGASSNVRRTGEGPETRHHAGTSEPTMLEIPGGKERPENKGFSRMTSKINQPPLVVAREPAVSKSSVTGSKESANTLTLNATSSRVELSWEVAEGLFDGLLLSYRDPATNTVLPEMVLSGDQRNANITGLTVGKSYEVSLYGTSGDNPSQLINITKAAVSGPDEGPMATNMESSVFQTTQVESQDTGSKEEEDEEEEEEEEEEEAGQEEVEEELTAPPKTELENSVIPNVTSENLTLWGAPAAYNDSLSSPQNSSQIQAAGDLRPFDLSVLTPAVNSNITYQIATDDKLSTPLTDQVASFHNVTVTDITSKTFRLSWKVPKGAFDSFVLQYRVSTGSARWEERKVQGLFRSTVVKGLSPATEYTVRLYGVSDGRRTEPFTIIATTDKVKPLGLGKLDRLASSNITDRSVQLTWNAERDFDTFLIHYKVTGSKGVQKFRLPGNLRSSIITGLKPSTKYAFYLYGVSSGQRTKPITTIITTTDKDAVKLVSLSTSNVTANSLRLSWTVDRAFDSFLIQYRVQGSEQIQNITVTGGRRSHLIVGLRPATRYTVYLYGISGALRTEPLTTVATTTAQEQPQKSEVSDLSVSNITADSLQLSWLTKREYDSFLVEYGAEEDQEMLSFTVAGDRRSSLITGLRPTTAYTIYLYGVSAGGQRTRPLTAVATTTASTDQVKGKPSKVIKLENLSVSNITVDSCQLSWGAEKVFDSFIIQYGVRGSEDVQNLTVTGDRRLSLITGLRPSTVYIVYVYGISAGVRTKPLTTVITTKASSDQIRVKPSKVIKLENLSVSNVTADSFQLSWGAEKVFDSFIIQYGVRGSEDVQNLTVTSDRRLSLITGLRPSTVYTVYVYGISAGVRTKPLTTVINTKASTDQIKVKPSKVIKLGNLSVSKVTVDSFQLSWGAEKVFDSFIIQYGVRGSEDVQNLTVTGDRRLSLITGLRPSTVYTVYVYGISAGVRTKPLTTVISTKASTDQIKVKPSKVIKLENLSVSNVTADSFQLSWGAEKVIDSFIIQYGVRGSEDVQNLTVAGDRRLSLITGLRPSTVYTVYVYGISAGVRTKPLTTVITTKASTDQIKVKPSKVIKLENLSVSNVTADSFQLSWGAEKVIDSFIIQYGVRGSEDVQNLTVAGDRRLSLITGLRPSTVYTVYVYGISAGVRTKPLTTVITTKASTDQIKIKPSKTIKLENLSVSNITVDSFQLSWAAEKVFDSFIIQYGVRGSEDVQNLTVTGDHRLYLITGLRPSTVYTVYVYGITAGVRTKPLTTEINTKASTEKPSKVKKLGPLLVSNVTADSARLSWPPQQGIDFYMVQYRVRGSAAVHNITVTGDRRFVIITGLKPTTKYLFSLYSVAGGQRKKSLTLQVTTKAPAGRDKLKPSKVTKLGSLSVSNVTSDSIPLSWTAEKGFDAFLIRYKVHGSGAVQNFTVTGDHRSTTITGLRPSTKYTVSVYGVYNGQRTKPLSRVITTKASTHQDAVKLGSLSTSNVTANSLRLSWTADRVFDSFLIQYKLQGSEETQNITVTGGRRSHLIVGLRPATRYTVFLYGISGALRTGPLTTVATTTASADKDTVTPVQLGSLSTSNVTANSLRLSWTVNGTFDSFLIQYKVQGSEETQNITVTGGRRSHLIVGLRPATRYTVYLYGIFNGKRTKPLTAVVSTTVSMDTNGIKPSRLSKLIRLSGNNVTQDSLQIFWAAESGFDSFLIQYRVEGSEELQNFTVPGDQQSSFIRGLRPSTKYLISLYGLSGSRRTRPLTTILTTAASTDNEGVKSGNLGSLSFSNITADSLQLSWTAETVFDSFLIQYKAQGSETLQNITVTGDRRSAYITGLRPTTNYTIYLHGVSDGQLSRPLVALLTITAIPVHTAGFNTLGRLLVSDVDTHSLKLSWTVEEGAFDSFLVQYRDSQGQLEAQEVRVSGNLRDVTIADLRPGTEYLISLYGVLKNQQTEPIPIMARTARESRSRLSFTDLGATSVTVNWEAPSVPVDTFKIFYVPTKQGEPRSVITEGGKTNITLTGLVPATQYEINLVAVRGSIESPPILDHFTTAPDAPSDLKAVNVSQTMALLIWRPAIASIDHYVITYGDGRTVPDASKNVPGNTAELQLTGLSMNTEYTAQIYGVKGGSKSSKLSTTFVTDSDLPRELTVRDISSSEALVSWTAPRAPVTGYLLLYGTGGDVTQRAMLDATATSHRLHHLLPSTGYTVRLHALRGTDRAAAITAPFSTVGAHIPFPKDCGEEHSNGRTESSTVTLYLNGNKDKPIKVYCDMRTDGGGWMVFQRRINGKTNFMRTWKAYVAGFGELAQEHWLGLENLHQLTSQRRYELRVDLRNGNESAYATYDNFVVESAAQKYRLRLGKYAGNAGNSLSYHHGSNFTTLDADNDEALTNCAMSYRGGWWYKNCHRVNLNGEYGNNRDHQGVNWYGWKGFEFSIPFTEMKMRPYNFARVVRKE
ncbi:tenascin-X-like isoform X2 [Heterodontus francisci]|uniref:tenascin-X-like isoform X2 n=1 Tax=Heterodontus francisci TaxID=7792 RepID=UPI00355B60D4